MLKDGTTYHDLGCDHFKRHSAGQQKSTWSSVCQSSATSWNSSRSPEPCLWRCPGRCGPVLAGKSRSSGLVMLTVSFAESDPAELEHQWRRCRASAWRPYFDP
jgi:hypothetical protein